MNLNYSMQYVVCSMQYAFCTCRIFNLLSGNCGFGRLTSSSERFLTRGYLNAIKVEQWEDITDCAIYNITIS